MSPTLLVQTQNRQLPRTEGWRVLTELTLRSRASSSRPALLISEDRVPVHLTSLFRGAATISWLPDGWQQPLHNLQLRVAVAGGGGGLVRFGCLVWCLDEVLGGSSGKPTSR